MNSYLSLPHTIFLIGILLFIQLSGCNSSPPDSPSQTADSTSIEEKNEIPEEHDVDSTTQEEAVQANSMDVEPEREQVIPVEKSDKTKVSKVVLWDADVEADDGHIVTPVEIATIDKSNKVFFRVPIHYSVDGESIIAASDSSRKEDDFQDIFRSSQVITYDIENESLKNTWKSPADEDSKKLFSSFTSKLSMDGSTLGVVWDSAKEIRIELRETTTGEMSFEKQFTKAKRDFLSDCSENELSTFEISPDGEKIIVYIACQENIECWNASSGETEWSFKSKDFHFAVGHPIDFSPTEDEFAICNGNVEIRSLSTGELLRQIEVLNAESIDYQWIDDLRYTKDGKSLFITSRIEYEHPTIRRFAKIDAMSLQEHWEIETIIGGLDCFYVMNDDLKFAISGLTEDGNNRVEFRGVSDGELVSAFEFDPSTDDLSHESNIAIHPKGKNVVIETLDSFKVYEIPELPL